MTDTDKVWLQQGRKKTELEIANRMSLRKVRRRHDAGAVVGSASAACLGTFRLSRALPCVSTHPTPSPLALLQICGRGLPGCAVVLYDIVQQHPESPTELKAKDMKQLALWFTRFPKEIWQLLDAARTKRLIGLPDYKKRLAAGAAAWPDGRWARAFRRGACSCRRPVHTASMRALPFNPFRLVEGRNQRCSHGGARRRCDAGAASRELPA